MVEYDELFEGDNEVVDLPTVSYGLCDFEILTHRRQVEEHHH